ELEGMAKLLYDYWFVQHDFPISAAQAAALGKPHLTGKPYRSSGCPMAYNPQLKREIPVGWLAGNILDVSKLGGGGTPSKKNLDWWNGDIPFFTPTDTTGEVFCLRTEDKITSEGLKKSATKLYTKGTLFITARGSVGRVVIISCDAAMSQSCYALMPNVGVSSGFLYFHIHALMGYLKAKSSGSVFKSIVTNDLIFSPSIVPAQDILESFGKLTSPIFSQILNNQLQNQELAQLRDWLLPMLM
ncbi:MAG: restriction endonuclease subunit S, partial [Akkermansiaceae bacterium]